MPSKYLIALGAITLCLTQAACLKTRAQLKEDGSDDAAAAKPQPAQVQEVQPEGRYAIDEIKGEMTRLEGRVEDLERAQKQASAGQPDQKKLESRITDLENAQAQMIETLKKIQGDVQANEDPSSFFDQAKAQYASGDYQAAIQNLNSYLQSAKAKQPEDATFMRGEAYFKLQDFNKAIVDFSKFPEKFTRSPHMPAALLLIAQSFDAIGSHDDAKAFYQELVEKYPKSPEARSLKKKKKQVQ
jgi:TolA-binding protein